MESAPSPTTHQRIDRTQTLVVLALALALRMPALWIALTQHPPQWFFTRGVEMGLLADSLLHGTGLSSPFGYAMGPTGPTAFIAPAYPIFVAGVFRVFGSYSVASEAFILSLHVLLNLLTIWFMMALCRRLLDRRAALLAGLFWACSPPLLWLPTIFWETSFSICMMTGLVWFALRYKDNPARMHWIVAGLVSGIAVLFNSALLLPVVAIVCWLAWKNRAAGQSTLLNAVFCGLTFLVVFSPWPIRNARVFHAFIPLRTTVGFELWMGNRDGATGYLEESLFPMYDRDELTTYIREGEIAYNREKTSLAEQYILNNPRIFIELSLKRFVRFWMGTGVKEGSIFFAAQSCLTTLLGLAGLCMLWQRRRSVAMLFALPLLLFPLPYYVTHAEFRYRLVIDPLLTVLSAYAVVAFRERRLEARAGSIVDGVIL